MATLNISDYGAAVDGTTDDTQAVQDAFADAAPGDEVYFPAGTTLVKSPQPDTHGVPALCYDEADHASDVTLRGEGADTVVKLDGGHSKNHMLLTVNTRENGLNLAIRDMTFDGNKANNSGKGRGVQIRHRNTSSPGKNDILLRNIHIYDANTKNLALNANGIRVERSSITGAGQKHGIGIRPDNRFRPRIEVSGCYCANNGLYGIDASSGYSYIEDCVLENNGWGTKTTHDTHGATYRRVRLHNNSHMGYTRPPTDQTISQRTQLEMDKVIATSNGWAGFIFPIDTDATVGTILAKDNCQDNQVANVLIKDDANVDATEIRSHNAANGTGLNSGTAGTARVDTYKHSLNPNGPLGGTDNLSIGEQVETDIEDITEVPTADEVGFGTTGDSGGSFKSNGGVISTTN